MTQRDQGSALKVQQAAVGFCPQAPRHARGQLPALTHPQLPTSQKSQIRADLVKMKLRTIKRAAKETRWGARAAWGRVTEPTPTLTEGGRPGVGCKCPPVPPQCPQCPPGASPVSPELPPAAQGARPGPTFLDAGQLGLVDADLGHAARPVPPAPGAGAAPCRASRCRAPPHRAASGRTGRRRGQKGPGRAGPGRAGGRGGTGGGGSAAPLPPAASPCLLLSLFLFFFFLPFSPVFPLLLSFFPLFFPLFIYFFLSYV